MIQSANKHIQKILLTNSVLVLVVNATGPRHQTPVTVAEVVVETVVVVVVWPQERGRKINGDAWFRG